MAEAQGEGPRTPKDALRSLSRHAGQYLKSDLNHAGDAQDPRVPPAVSLGRAPRPESHLSQQWRLQVGRLCRSRRGRDRSSRRTLATLALELPLKARVASARGST